MNIYLWTTREYVINLWHVNELDTDTDFDEKSVTQQIYDMFTLSP